MMALEGSERHLLIVLSTSKLVVSSRSHGIVNSPYLGSMLVRDLVGGCYIHFFALAIWNLNCVFVEIVNKLIKIIKDLFSVLVKIFSV